MKHMSNIYCLKSIWVHKYANENLTVRGRTKGMGNDKILLVYSGGLDTSICIPMMREEYGYKEVVTVTIDVGQDPADIEQAEAKAKQMKTEHYTVDAKEIFVEKFCWPAVQANG